MRKGFLAAVGATLIAGGSAMSQAPYGYPYAPGHGGYYAQPSFYANGYGYANGYAPSYGYSAPVGYASQMTYRPSYAYVPGYGYYPMPAGYANAGYANTAYPSTAQAPTPVPTAVTQEPTIAVRRDVAEVVAQAPAAALPVVPPPEKVAPKPAPVPMRETDCRPTGAADCTSPQVCGPAGRGWFSAEYLLWWIKGNQLPPLVTTGPADLTQVPPPGALGAPGTAVLFGGDQDQGLYSGGRFTAGFWLNKCRTVGLEGSYFFLGARSNDFTAASSGAPGSIVLARPFFDVSTGLPNSELFAFPGLASGSVSVGSSSRLQGAEANLLCNLCCSCADACADCDPCRPARGYRVDFLSGFRYLDLDEGLGIVENLQVFPGAPVFAGSNISVYDQFDTRNQFYGAQVGVRVEVWRRRLFANIAAKVALGNNQQTVGISGVTTITPPGGVAVVSPGGLLALPSNIGSYSRNVFSVVPEVNVNAGFQVTNQVRVYTGYSFLYASSFARPEDQIDLRVNSTRVPTAVGPPTGPLAPLFDFGDSDFWAQGITFGVQVRY